MRFPSHGARLGAAARDIRFGVDHLVDDRHEQYCAVGVGFMVLLGVISQARFSRFGQSIVSSLFTPLIPGLYPVRYQAVM